MSPFEDMGKTSSKTIYKAAGHSFVIRVGGVAALLFAHVLLARFMSLEDYGLYSYAIQLVGILAVIGSLGMNQVAVRAIPQVRLGENRFQIERFVVLGFATSILFCATISLLFYALLDNLFRYISNEWTGVFNRYTLLLLLALIFLRFGQEVMRGQKRIVLSQVFEQLVLPTSLILFVSVAFFFQVSLTNQLALTIHMAVVGVGAVVLATLLLKGGGLQPYIESSSTDWLEDGRHWTGIGVPLAIASLFALTLARGDIIILGFFMPPDEIAPYSAAARIAGLMIFGLSAANAIAAPVFAEMWQESSKEELQEQIYRAGGLATLFSVPLLFVFIVFAEAFLGLFGSDYRVAANILRILALGKLINAITGPVGPLMVATGRQKLYLSAVACASVLMTVLVLVLVPVMGLNGAALGTTIAVIILNVFLSIYAYHVLKLKTFVSISSLYKTGQEMTRLARQWGAAFRQPN